MSTRSIILSSLICLAGLISISCERNTAPSLQELNLEKIYGEKSWQEVLDSENVVFYFLAPECPLCQNYSVAMNKLKKDYDDIEFIGIFPGEEYTREEIKSYLIKFKLDLNSYLDPDFKLTNMMQAEITPEAFLMNKSRGLTYSGAIDNWAISLGKKRTVVTENFLETAINSTLRDQEVEIKKTKAVGCFIQ